MRQGQEQEYGWALAWTCMHVVCRRYGYSTHETRRECCGQGGEDRVPAQHAGQAQPLDSPGTLSSSIRSLAPLKHPGILGLRPAKEGPGLDGCILRSSRTCRLLHLRVRGNDKTVSGVHSMHAITTHPASLDFSDPASHNASNTYLTLSLALPCLTYPT